ncbi:MAG TPA: MFS transporter [Alphaproteobacteria bacterium]|nr:MFS transporter [Alphaproteobacteria bacterium]
MQDTACRAEPGPIRDNLARFLLTAFVPYALGYFLSYLYRGVNAVIGEDLQASTGIDALELSIVTSAYLITFAAMQLPIGILLDRFGPRRVGAFLLVVASAGAAIFALAEGVVGLTVGRGLIGIGVSACLVAGMKNNADWWPPRQIPLANGLIMAAGGLGVLTSTTPVRAAVDLIGWREAFLVLAAVTFAAALYLYFLAPDAARDDGRQLTWRQQLRGMAHVASHPLFWRVAPATVVVQSSFIAYQSLWAGQWLADIGGHGLMAVTVVLQMLAVSMIVGSVVMGGLAVSFARWGIRPITVAAALNGAYLAVFALIAARTGMPETPLWMAVGFLGAATILPYAVLAQAFPPHLAGRVSALLNVLCFVGAFAVQNGIGFLVDAMAEGGTVPVSAHRIAMAAILAVGVVAQLWWFRPLRPQPAGPSDH